MDTAEQLAVDSGAAAVTVRALSELTLVSNGAIYHAFGSRAGLVGRVWVRAARRFLTVQNDSVDAAVNSANGSAVEAVVAAADAPAAFLLDFPRSGRFLLAVSRSELLGSADIPAEVADDLRGLDRSVADLLIRLSKMMWGRADRDTVAIIKDCVVELPTALLLRGERTPEPVVRERLACAVRAVLTIRPIESPSSTDATNR